MADIQLGINNCFALGRFPEPEEWLRIVKDELGLSHVQFSFDLLDPVIIEDEVFREKCAHIKKLADSKNVAIDTGSTGEVPHKFNLLLDPDPGMRRCYLRWYERLIRAGNILGVEASGVYMGSLSQKDQESPKRREYLISVLLEELVYLTGIAKEVGQKYFLWENLSIPREVPSTIEETKELIERVNEHSHVPVRLCLDVGHGYIKSSNPRDYDPYSWLEEFADITPVVHMQQTDGKGSRHWPFTKEYNAKGHIVPDRIIETIEASGAQKVTLVFEFFYSSHALSDESALDNLKSSVEYWQNALHKAYF
jgi:sugar phosphate isomerase/epimerase